MHLFVVVNLSRTAENQQNEALGPLRIPNVRKIQSRQFIPFGFFKDAFCKRLKPRIPLWCCVSLQVHDGLLCSSRHARLGVKFAANVKMEDLLESDVARYAAREIIVNLMGS